jgi:hypothetical protein
MQLQIELSGHGENVPCPLLGVGYRNFFAKTEINATLVIAPNMLSVTAMVDHIGIV